MTKAPHRLRILIRSDRKLSVGRPVGVGIDTRRTFRHKPATLLKRCRLGCLQKLTEARRACVRPGWHAVAACRRRKTAGSRVYLGNGVTVLGCPRFLSRLVYSAQDGRTGSRDSSKEGSGRQRQQCASAALSAVGTIASSSHVAQTAAMRQGAVPHLPARPSKVCGVRLRTQAITLTAKSDFDKYKNMPPRQICNA